MVRTQESSMNAKEKLFQIQNIFITKLLQSKKRVENDKSLGSRTTKKLEANASQYSTKIASFPSPPLIVKKSGLRTNFPHWNESCQQNFWKLHFHWVTSCPTKKSSKKENCFKEIQVKFKLEEYLAQAWLKHGPCLDKA